MGRPFEIITRNNGYTVVNHPGSVAILPVLDPSNPCHFDESCKILLCEQFRAGPEAITMELPAGTRDIEDESPMFCALRELQEKIGYRANYICPLGPIHPSPGYCSEVITLFLGGCLERIDLEPEFEPITVTVGQVLQYIAEGTVTDAKTIAAITRWNLLSDELLEKVKWVGCNKQPTG